MCHSTVHVIIIVVLVLLQLTIDMEHTHEMNDSQVQNQGERLPPDKKWKYHHVDMVPYILRQMVILMTALILADYLDPVGYIFTNSEYYGVPVSVKAKFVIVMVIICIGTVIGIHYGCHHHLSLEL